MLNLSSSSGWRRSLFASSFPTKEVKRTAYKKEEEKISCTHVGIILYFVFFPIFVSCGLLFPMLLFSQRSLFSCCCSVVIYILRSSGAVVPKLRQYYVDYTFPWLLHLSTTWLLNRVNFAAKWFFVKCCLHTILYKNALNTWQKYLDFQWLVTSFSWR